MAIGCVFSHIGAVEPALPARSDLVLLVLDDIPAPQTKPSNRYFRLGKPYGGAIGECKKFDDLKGTLVDVDYDRT